MAPALLSTVTARREIRAAPAPRPPRKGEMPLVISDSFRSASRAPTALRTPQSFDCKGRAPPSGRSPSRSEGLPARKRDQPAAAASRISLERVSDVDADDRDGGHARDRQAQPDSRVGSDLAPAQPDSTGSDRADVEEGREGGRHHLENLLPREDTVLGVPENAFVAFEGMQAIRAQAGRPIGEELDIGVQVP